MDMPLMISAAIRYAAAYHGSTEVVARTIEGDLHRYDYATAHARTQQEPRAVADWWRSGHGHRHLVDALRRQDRILVAGADEL